MADFSLQLSQPLLGVIHLIDSCPARFFPLGAGARRRMQPSCLPRTSRCWPEPARWQPRGTDAGLFADLSSCCESPATAAFLTSCCPQCTLSLLGGCQRDAATRQVWRSDPLTTSTGSGPGPATPKVRTLLPELPASPWTSARSSPWIWTRRARGGLLATSWPPGGPMAAWGWQCSSATCGMT